MIRINNLLTSKECKNLISDAESMGFESYPFRPNENEKLVSYPQRLYVKCPKTLYDIIYKRAEEFVPSEIKNNNEIWKFYDIGGSSRWKFNKYKNGDYFQRHIDPGNIEIGEKIQNR
eukprot:UN02573